MSAFPTPFEIWAIEGRNHLERELAMGHTTIKIAYVPALPPITASPVTEPNLTEVTTYLFDIEFLFVDHKRHDGFARFIKITDEQRNVVELRPASNYELTLFSNRVNRG